MSADEKVKADDKAKPADKPKASDKPAAKADPAQTHLEATWKHARPLTACRFDPLGRFVFTGAEDFFIVRWNLADGKPTPFEGHGSWVRALAFSPDGETLYSGGYDGKLIRWSVTADKPVPLQKIDAHNGWVRGLVSSPDGKLLASCGNDNLVKLWNAADGKLLHEFKGHESHVYNVAFHPSGTSLASCELKGVFKHWDIATAKEVRSLTAPALHKYDTTFRADIGGARSLAFSGDGKLLLAGGITNVSNAFAGIGNPAAVSVEWDTFKVKTQHGGKEKISGVIWGLNWHPDGYWVGLSGGSGGGMLYFWKNDAADEFAKFKLPDTGRDLDLHRDGLRVAVAHFDGNVRIYRLGPKAT